MSKDVLEATEEVGEMLAKLKGLPGGDLVQTTINHLLDIMDKDTTIRIGKVVYLGITATNIFIERKKGGPDDEVS